MTALSLLPGDLAPFCFGASIKNLMYAVHPSSRFLASNS
jgi:hypothetical protein